MTNIFTFLKGKKNTEIYIMIVCCVLFEKSKVKLYYFKFFIYG